MNFRIVWIIFLVLLTLLAIFVISIIKILTIIIPIVAVRLGITNVLVIALLLVTGGEIRINFLGLNLFVKSPSFLDCINLPLCMVAVQNKKVRYELFPIWLVRRYQRAYRLNFQHQMFIGINVAGGLLPLTIALYQFHRVSPSAILTVTAIVAAFCYFSVTVVPGIMIHFKPGLFWVVPTIAALSSMWIVGEGIARADVSVAFASSVLGSLIGVDLLHLKDIHPERATTSLNIGGAGIHDGIVLSGLYSLLLTEWMPKLVTFLNL